HHSSTSTFYTLSLHDALPIFFDGAASFQNLSARAHVFTGERILIAGLIIGGTENKKVLIRGLGPSLASFGVPSPLADPTLSLYRSEEHTSELQSLRHLVCRLL